MREINFSSLLGMSEMEWTVKFMVEEAEKKNEVWTKMLWYPEQFVDPKKLSRLVGFCQLVARELMVPDYPNCVFIPSDKLVDIVNVRLGTDWPHALKAVDRLCFPEEKS